MDQLGLGARVRRRESLSVLKTETDKAEPAYIGYGEESTLPQDPSAPPDTNELQKFKDELLGIDRKKREHLRIPPSPKGGLMRWSTVLVVLLFIIAAGLFFLGGYLYSYNNPPASANLSTSSATPAADTRTDWRLGTVVESPAPVQARPGGEVPTNYKARRVMIERNQALADRVYGDTESRVNYAARQEAKRIVNKTTNNIKAKMRDVFGATVGRVLSPVADSVVAGTMGAAVEGTLPVESAVQTAMDAAQGGASEGAAAGGGESAAAPGSGAAGGAGASATGGDLSGDAGAAASAPADPVAPSGAASDGVGDLFALELQTFYDSTDAFLFMRQLREKGYSAAYMLRTNQGKTVVFKVRVGNFATYADAAATRKLIGHPSRVVLATRQDDPMAY